MTADRTTGFTDIDRQHWSLRYLPPWARPYGRLARWDRPIGIWLLMLPCWWSLALGAAPEWGRLAGWMALFALGALAMRGAGCTWNDIVDRKVDARVERTRGRPLPSGEVTLRNALIWMVLQSLVGVAILFKLNKFAGGVALASLVLVAIYPTMKRLTSWPQVVLGLAFNWGALVGYAAVTGTLSWATVALYAGGVAWTMVYDTIYAMQDQRDDAVIGVGSTARRFAAAPRRWLTLFAVLALRRGRWPAISLPSARYYFAILLAIALHFALADRLPEAAGPGRLPRQVQGQRLVGLLLTVAVIAGHLALDHGPPAGGSRRLHPRQHAPSRRRRWCRNSGCGWPANTCRSGRRPRRGWRSTTSTRPTGPSAGRAARRSRAICSTTRPWCEASG